MDDQIFFKLFHRRADSHKYDYGHVLVIGGSPGMVGAPLLAGRAALRTGAGLVTIASRFSVTNKLEERVDEIMTLAIASNAASAFATIRKYIVDRKVSVIVIGPGLRTDSEATDLVVRLVKEVGLPMIIDGGGLSILQTKLTLLNIAPSKALLFTPHVGEFQRMIDEKLPLTRQALKPIAAHFADTFAVTLVLKGQPTYIAAPHMAIYENTTGNPGLATAGTGDVLSGIIAGILGQGLEARNAAIGAVYIHGLAGDIAAQEKTELGMIASDVIDALPDALKAIKKQQGR